MRIFGRLGFIFIAMTVGAIIVIYAPIVGLVFTTLKSAEVTPENIYDLTVNSKLIPSLNRSLRIGLLSSAMASALALGMVLTIAQVRNRVALLIKSYVSIPMVFPEIVFGISLLIWLSYLGIQLGETSILISHVTFILSFSYIVIHRGYMAIDPALFEAARDLGASQLQLFSKVTLPLLVPSLIGSFLLGFMMSFDDFLISFFMAGIGSDTLPMKIYSLLRYGLSIDVKLISTLIVLMTFVLATLLIAIFKKAQDKSSELKKRI